MQRGRSSSSPRQGACQKGSLHKNAFSEHRDSHCKARKRRRNHRRRIPRTGELRWDFQTKYDHSLKAASLTKSPKRSVRQSIKNAAQYARSAAQTVTQAAPQASAAVSPAKPPRNVTFTFCDSDNNNADIARVQLR